MGQQTFIEIFTRLQEDRTFRRQLQTNHTRALAPFDLRREQIDGVLLRSQWIDPLRALPIFGKLSPHDLADLLTRMEEGRYHPGDVLMVQGDPGDWFHYIIQGKVEVLQAKQGQDLAHSKRIATLGVGEPVGELALSFNTPRNATVRALTEVHTLSLEAADFRELFRRGAVA